MPKTVQIRDIDDDLYLALTQRAAEYGISVPELLRREAEKLVRKPSMKEWLERTRNRSTPGEPIDVIEALDEIRGPWPDADR
jgi:antitoxin FitA